jgi:hypothetical protein
MTPAGLALLLDERGRRLDAERGVIREAPDTSAGAPYSDPMEFVALAAMSTA